MTVAFDGLYQCYWCGTRRHNGGAIVSIDDNKVRLSKACRNDDVEMIALSKHFERRDKQ